VIAAATCQGMTIRTKLNGLYPISMTFEQHNYFKIGKTPYTNFSIYGSSSHKLSINAKSNTDDTTKRISKDIVVQIGRL
jgi:hypothetical protein